MLAPETGTAVCGDAEYSPTAPKRMPRLVRQASLAQPKVCDGRSHLDQDWAGRSNPSICLP